jgi:5'-nucleotidase
VSQTLCLQEGIDMPLDLSETLVVGIASTALFNLSEADAMFRKRFAEDRYKAVAEYR